MAHRTFTVEEANRELPHVRRVLRELHQERRLARERADKLGVLDVLWGERLRRPGNPDHDEFLDHRRAIDEALARAEALVRQELVARGIRFPTGGLAHGLVDFPSTLDGRWVYLCWQKDEPEVLHWHEVDGGFRGRRPITEEERRRMGREDDPEGLDDSVLDF